jgi:hypothetical protein
VYSFSFDILFYLVGKRSKYAIKRRLDFSINDGISYDIGYFVRQYKFGATLDTGLVLLPSFLLLLCRVHTSAARSYPNIRWLFNDS